MVSIDISMLTRYKLFFVAIFCFVGSGVVSSPQSTEAQQTESQDRIWYQPADETSADSGLLPKPIELIAGKVLEANAEVFKVERSAVSEPVFLTTDRLVWLEPAWANAEAAKGMAQFQAGDYAASIDSLYAGIQRKPPVWQQQWLLAHLALAAFEAERYPSVMQLAEDLSNSNPPPTFLGMLPIHWSSRSMSASAIAAARTKINSQQPFVRLIAASWLLGSPEDRALAERTLEALAVDRRNRLLTSYATVLRWRRTPVPGIAEQANDWIESVEKLPIMLQPGPLLTIADRLQAAGEADRANELFHSVSLLHQHPKPLSDRAKAELKVGSAAGG